MSDLRVGQRITIIGPRFRWEGGQRAPSWCVVPGRTFEIIQIDRRNDGSYRVVIGNHRLNNGPITHGVTGAVIVV